MSVVTTLARRTCALRSIGTWNCQKCFIRWTSDNSNYDRNYYKRCDEDKRSRRRRLWLTAVTGIAIGVGTSLAFADTKIAHLSAAEKEDILENFGKYRKELPVYSWDEVSEHHDAGKRIWVTYKSGVYDITEFVDKHPGGDKIMMAAGGSVEPFWVLYAVHQNIQVLEMLEKYRIGNLSAEDRGRAVANMDDPYADDPKRHPALVAASQKPFNAETPPSLLVDSHITPTDLFYVRNHLPAAKVDVENYELEVGIEDGKTIVLKLNDLKKKFEHHTITATLQCAGNRRGEMIKVKEVKGLNWGMGAVGTATWTGVWLRDVLRHAGIDANDKNISHIQFEGYDTDPGNMAYGASIPVEKAFDPRGDVLLAFEMNGQPLTRDHGFPVRVVVPGTVAARSVKWLGRITASPEESPSHWQQNDYKSFNPGVDWLSVDFTSAPAIQDVPIISAICEPRDGTVMEPTAKHVTVKGYAWSGGGRKVIRVDVSSDGGKNWQVAHLEPDPSTIGRSWAWRLWKCEVPLPKVDPEKVKEEKHELEIICKAVDSSYNNQPDSVSPIWNLRGVLNNAWHRVRIQYGPPTDDLKVIEKKVWDVVYTKVTGYFK